MVDTTRLELLLATATDMGLEPQVVNDRGLISIKIEGRERYLFHKVSNPNDQMASWLSENKYVSRIIFERNHLPNIPYCLPESLSVAQDFLSEHGKIVVKPIKGKQSQNIRLVSSQEDLAGADLSGSILEKFIKGQEVRFLVVKSRVAAVHHKIYPGEINDPKHVQRVSIAKQDWDLRLADLAVKAAEAIGLIFTAIDFLVTQEGSAYILEINSAPGLDRFQTPDQGPPVDAMRLYLEQAVANYSSGA